MLNICQFSWTRSFEPPQLLVILTGEPFSCVSKN
jgi:hypothetical protein